MAQDAQPLRPIPAAPGFIASGLRIFDLSLGEMLWSKRTIFMMLVAGAPVVIALLLRIVVAFGAPVFEDHRTTQDGVSQTIRMTLTRPESGGARIVVDDEGPGIPPDERARIWQPFYRLDRDRSAPAGGSGPSTTPSLRCACGRVNPMPGRGPRPSKTWVTTSQDSWGRPGRDSSLLLRDTRAQLSGRVFGPMPLIGPSWTSGDDRLESAKWAKADIDPASPNDRVSPDPDLARLGQRQRPPIENDSGQLQRSCRDPE